MVFGVPLAVMFGILAFVSLFITAGLGITIYKYRKPVFKKHLFFAVLTVILAIIHVVLVVLWLYFDILI